LLVVPSRVHKWSINPFTNPNPVYNHPYYLTIWWQTENYKALSTNILKRLKGNFVLKLPNDSKAIHRSFIRGKTLQMLSYKYYLHFTLF
jgi:hypothetical protein